MFERFTDEARRVVVLAQDHARRLHHWYIGCEHLLLAIVAEPSPASAVLNEHGVTRERVEEQIIRIIGAGHVGDLFRGVNGEALAAIGIDLDTVRARIGAAFGPEALERDVQVVGRGGLLRRRRRRRVRRAGGPPTGPGRRGHIPFTDRAKKALGRSLRESQALGDNYIGVQHVALALLSMDDGMVPLVLSAVGVSSAQLRTAILDRYRKAG